MLGNIDNHTALAVIGLACRFPGADDPDEYWALIRDGRSAVGELPPDRLNTELYYAAQKGRPGKTYTKLGGMVAEHARRRDTPATADPPASTDISHNIMLDVALTACRDAGYDPADFPYPNTGVYVGHARGSTHAGEIHFANRSGDISQYLMETDGFARFPKEVQTRILKQLEQHIRAVDPRRETREIPGLTAGHVSAAISRTLGLTGPHMAVDAACASSMFALAAAAHALADGRMDTAIVGGASYSSWQSLVLFSRAQALSAHHSRPFDAAADGFISSDGYGAVVIKPLARALTDKDKIRGIIHGFGLSSDGGGKSLWAPRKEGQIEAIRRAYENGTDPGRLQYIEAHGTSTQLGDATEIHALHEALGPHLPKGRKLPLASVKANIGHTREAAGLAGLIKVILAMENGIVPPAVGFQTPNPKVPWDETAFFVPQAPTAWAPHPDDGSRWAAVNAFGIGGLNAHFVVERPHGQTPGRCGASSPSRPPPNDGGGKKPDPVAIIGWGAIFPSAATVDDYWQLLVSGHDPKTVPPNERREAGEMHRGGEKSLRTGGFVTDFTYDWWRHKVPPRQLETADPLQFMLLDAADQALGDAGYGDKQQNRGRTGVVIGTMFGGDFSTSLNLALHLPEFEHHLMNSLVQNNVPDESAREITTALRNAYQRAKPMLQDETGSYTSSTLASRLARSLDLMGGAFAVDAGEASAMAALRAATDLLRSGSCDMVLCAGAQRAMNACVHDALARNQRLSRGKPKAAFDRDATGYVPGEGVGVLVLKRLGDAAQSNDPVRAIIQGMGESSDAKTPAAAMERAIQGALESAGQGPGDIVAVETAGTAVPDIDTAELRALTATYGAHDRLSPLQLGSVAGQIGHTQGASGMASLLKMALALQKRTLPASMGPRRPVAGLAEASTRLQAVSRTRSLPAENGRDADLAGVSAFAFSGLAYHVLVGRRPAPAPEIAVTNGPWRMIKLGASTMTELSERIKGCRNQAQRLYSSSDHMRFTPEDTVRLAMVVDGPDALTAKLKTAEAGLLQPNARTALEDKGIFIRQNVTGPPRVCLLFPGQGSQYPGMLEQLTRRVPAAARKLAEVDRIMKGKGHPSFSEMVFASDNRLGVDTWHIQASMLLADTIMFAAFESLGFGFDAISGHSFGEYPALVAARAWSLEEAIDATHARCRLMAADPEARGALLATNAPRPRIEQISPGPPDDVTTAIVNAPDQIVVGGRSGAVDALGAQLVAEGFQAKRLPVPHPFHTPLMAGIQDALRDVLAQKRIRPPRIPFLSNVTNRYVADPDDIRDNLVAQPCRPLLYVDLIQRLMRDETTVFVEIGPGRVLTRLHRRILGGADALAVACDAPRKSAVEQLLRVRAALECAGAAAGRPGPDNTFEIPRPNPTQGSVIHFDATARRKQALRQAAISKPTPRPANGRVIEAGTPERDDPDELSAFLIDFVCEQTGYPRDVVELDADLEADLGIDSLKKAQLLSELNDRHELDIGISADLSLDAFPTLHSIIDFLKCHGVGMEQIAGGTSHGRSESQSRAVTAAEPVRPGQPRPGAPASSVPLDIVRCAGTPHEIGMQVARFQEGPIRHLLATYSGMVGRRLDQTKENVDELQQLIPEATQFFGEDGCRELNGMADALGLPADYLIALNLSLYTEHSAGCAHFAVAARRGDPMIHGANEDWPMSLRIPDCFKRVLLARHPKAGFPHILFNTAGQLGGLTGINSAGVAVSSAMLLNRPWSAAPGLIHSVLVKTILERAENIDDAVEIVRSLNKNGAWSMCVTHHPSDRLCYLEYDGAALHIRADRDRLMGTNHFLLDHPSSEPPPHSTHRFNRLQELLGGQNGCSPDKARAILRDRFDPGRRRRTAHPTMNTVLRVDNLQSIVMQPGLNKIWVTPGPAHGPGSDQADPFHAVEIADLLGSDEPGISTAGAPLPPPSKAATNERLMRRFVMRMHATPLAAGTPARREWGPAALILGDNPAVGALHRTLADCGVTATCLPVTMDADKALSTLRRLWHDRPIPHLFVLSPLDKAAACGLTSAQLGPRRPSGLLLPYLICQKWTELISADRLRSTASLTAVTALGGDFGFSGRFESAEGGGLTGLFKSIRHEYGDLLIKTIDTSPTAPPEEVADLIVTELRAATPDIEVGYINGKRHLVRAVPKPASPVKTVETAADGAVLVTGGARGITALVARHLGVRLGQRLHLIGSSPAPQVEERLRQLDDHGLRRLKAGVMREARDNKRDAEAAWRGIAKAVEIDRTLGALEADGVKATYHPCDVADMAALGAVLQKIRAADGPINGIIHGAGVEHAARFGRKRLENIAATLDAKVDGTVALMELTRDDPLAFFVVFSSVSGRFGGLGQTDYAMACDMQSKLIQRYRRERSGCAAVAVHWPAWDGVGMAMRPESRLAIEMGRQRFMSPGEGIAHLMDEIRAGAPEGEVLIFDRPNAPDLSKPDPAKPDPAEPDPAEPDPVIPDQPHNAPAPDRIGQTLRRHRAVAAAPLVEGLRVLREGRELITEIRFDPTTDPFLTDHLFRGTPMLPAVISMEALAEAAALLSPANTVVGLEQVTFAEGFRFFNQTQRKAYVEAASDGRIVNCRLRSEFFNRDGKLIAPKRVYVSGQVELATMPPPPTPPMPNRPPDTWHDMLYPGDLRVEPEGLVVHGPRLRALKKVRFDDTGGWGRISAPPTSDLGPNRGREWIIPAAVLDACLVACGVFTRQVQGFNPLPRAIGKLQLAGLPKRDEECTVRLRLADRGTKFADFDFVLFGEDDRVILSARGYRCTLLKKTEPST